MRVLSITGRGEFAPRSPRLLSDRQFERFSTFIYETVGIKMPPTKQTMLEARLQKRLKALGLPDFDSYADFLFSPEGRRDELIHLIDAVTTNKTDFFREPVHFQILRDIVLSEIDQRRQGEPIRIWSAGCSSGEEPYTIAMVASEFSRGNRGREIRILASDVSTRVLETARTAIYTEEQAAPIPLEMKMKYLLRSKDPSRGIVRIRPEIRRLVTFRRINFMEDDFGIRERMDVIFCRNVMIYFDKPTQQNLLRKFRRQLRRGGYLFIGHSETLNGFELDFEPIGSAVYRAT
ncbi:MAG: protein-glutamate O-methyltransferase [Desulfuromonadia bacterium]